MAVWGHVDTWTQWGSERKKGELDPGETAFAGQNIGRASGIRKVLNDCLRAETVSKTL